MAVLSSTFAGINHQWVELQSVIYLAQLSENQAGQEQGKNKFGKQPKCCFWDHFCLWSGKN